MDKFVALKMFTATVEAEGFSAAARRLGLTTSSVTRGITALEKELGTTLLNRSTRKVTITDAGKQYYQQARQLLNQLSEMDEQFQDRRKGGKPQGHLSVSLPTAFGRDLMPDFLAEFLQLYPDIQFNLSISDQRSNLLNDSVDLAIRLGAPGPMSGVVSRTLGEFERVVVASPEYLESAGHPETPADLSEHDCIRFNYDDSIQVWRFRDSNEHISSVHVEGAHRSNSMEIIKAATLAHAGVALLPVWKVGAEIQQGRLIRLFADYDIWPNQALSVITALYLPGHRRSLRIHAFIDFISDKLHNQPGIKGI